MTSAPAELILVVNPVAGKGGAVRAGDAAEKALRARGAIVRRVQGHDSAETRTRLSEALSAATAGVVVVGGDGTLSDVVDVLVDAGVTLTVVPAGTGNDLARALGLPMGSAADAALLALTGAAVWIDVGTVQTAEVSAPRCFLTIVALGFDARVSERTNSLRYPRGPLRYYLALVIELLRLRPLPFIASWGDGARVVMPGTLLAVGNTAAYGGGMRMCAGAEPDDGLLDIVHVAPLTRLRLLTLFPLLLKGTHLSRPEVTHRRARTARISAPDLVVYADGERVGTRECTVSILPGALAVMRPPA